MGDVREIPFAMGDGDGDAARPPGRRRPDARGPAAARWGWLPTTLTLARIALLPALWLLAARGETFWLGLGVAVAASTDVLDGALARALGATSPLGSRLDSIADHLLIASVALWIAWLRPGFVAEQLPLLALWVAVGAAALAVGWLRFRRFGDLHLYSAKVAGTLGFLFAIGLLLFDSYSPGLFYLVIAACLAASVETLLVFLTRATVDERIGSIFSARRGGRGPGRGAGRE
jgi:cardiolipin synthase (CMP-forming)